MQPVVSKCCQIGRRQLSTTWKTLKKINRKISQWLTNSNLNVGDENLHRSPSSASNIKQGQIARTFRHNSKGIIIQDALQDLDGMTLMKLFFTGTTSFNRKFF